MYNKGLAATTICWDVDNRTYIAIFPRISQVGWIGVTLFEKICLIIASTIPEKTIDDARGRGKEGGAGILYSVYYVGEAESHLNDAMF